jgi:hypothetical protein
MQELLGHSSNAGILGLFPQFSLPEISIELSAPRCTPPIAGQIGFIVLGRTPVTVISSGCKSFLDIPRTLEYLETEGVCVELWQQLQLHFE